MPHMAWPQIQQRCQHSSIQITQTMILNPHSPLKIITTKSTQYPNIVYLYKQKSLSKQLSFLHSRLNLALHH